ncbi:MAG: pyruvate kinase [Terrisporobacter othiniensis]|uniref:Pyruvate kinase n=1 Tax=Terrisporobacter hibernicus TaxID=2813371 RepID=A0AAX2ZKK2_9FIRM|nr:MULTISPECIES: pyruvate kinase [Terrisporobacter]MDU4861229.1 pyruvate kinase [Terrisporobacter othiniensis]MDU6994863.1 pyruvate kinase [Terrisporobacter othiniensis]UEL49345.1 pyruvate kinase [Terrisporobacter hibernicus]SFJ54256.1 pyruvate kinase [Terrisporobacter glycolicus]
MLKSAKKTKIVCTLGPASQSEETLTKLMENGLNVCRFNFSHGSHEEHKERMDAVKKVREKLNKPVAILLDTKGPEIRTGNFADPEVFLEEGSKFTITMADVMGTKEICTVSYKGLADDVVKGDLILIDDGLVGLRVEEVVGEEIHCIVENSGIVKNHKGVNVPGVKINLPALTPKDISDIEFGITQGIDFIAASFVRKASDVLAIREVLENNDATYIQIISKIENQEGVDNLDEILQVSDGLMVARGDLGVEIPTEEMPIVQKEMIKKCNELGKPVITATQMLDSMIRNPRPTRAEVTDVANAIYDGTDAIMLSGETAAGKYPVEAVKTMATIAKRIEETLDYDNILRSKGLNNTNVTDAISYATCTTAKSLTASGIVTSTSSGHTARMVSKFRPNTPIIAATPNERTSRQLSLSWGVYTVNCQQAGNTDDLIDNSIEASKNEGFIHDGELVVITAGVPTGVSGTTNLIKVHVVSEEICQGIGIGRTTIEGNVRIVKSGESCENFNEGDILVTSMTDKEMNPYIEKAAAIVTEDGGMTSHAAIVGINLGKPVIVSATNILSNVEDGEIITVDTTRGAVYRGSSRVL